MRIGRWRHGPRGELAHWKGARLKVVDEQNLPQTMIAVGYFSKSAKDFCKMLEFIDVQNKSLRMTEWKVLCRFQNGAYKWVLSNYIDSVSAKQLKTNPLINHKFGLVQLRLKGV